MFHVFVFGVRGDVLRMGEWLGEDKTEVRKDLVWL